MHASLQARVLALVGVAVLLAVGALSLLSRSTLLSLHEEVAHDHERLAASVARDVSRAVGDDLRLLSGAATSSSGGLADALNQVRRFGRLSSAAFVVDEHGQLLACEPAFECRSLARETLLSAAQQAAATQRPFVGNALPHHDARVRITCAMPVRQLGGQTLLATGLVIDPADRRFMELVQVADLAATLRATLRDGNGHLLGTSASDSDVPAYIATANVAGTPWRLELSDIGPDPSAPVAAFRRRSIWMAPTLAAMATLLGWGIARSVRQPLVDLTGAAERIARGNLDEPIATARAERGGDEIARLAVALERMRQDLQGSIRQIEHANAELEERIAERTRELATLNASLEERERLRQRLLRQLISAQEDERKRIARELHDETSQSLAALGIGVDMAIASSDGSMGADARRRFEEVRQLVERMHHELHRMIVNLRPSVLDDLGLAAAIQWFAERHLVPAGVAVRCEFSGLDGRLPPEIETEIFRAVQEALTNVTRHAAAETVLIQGALADGRLTIEIEDDGKGFDQASVVRSPDSMRGIGLLGMRERLEILGGEMTIESSSGRGTRVVFDVPLPTDAATPAGRA